MDLSLGQDVDMRLLRDIICAGFSSPGIEAALEPCMKRCLYNGKKIDQDTFEPEETRQDYSAVCLEVALYNILPFTKGLPYVFKRLGEMNTVTRP
jgi:hypothetical protein